MKDETVTKRLVKCTIFGEFEFGEKGNRRPLTTRVASLEVRYVALD